MIERQKRNPKVLNRLEVYPRDVYHVAMEELKTYGGKVMLFPQQLEVYLGRRFRVAYEEAMKYGVEVIMRHFTLQVVLCDKMPLKRKIYRLEDSLLWFDDCGSVLLAGPWKIQTIPSKCSRLWCLCVLQLLDWIQSWMKK
ncbi:uncharacterized protein LOC115728150 isoform X5 [Rhodamnia argentea]|uniref:Uncharacterized protein LOC115728150 isoform X5 n=1 Tax=Rhodamnia argentea TaxID=178133 RepID=A0A8B8MW77_9MYRT|nr:uncharacterized protein LOC115728150 isoform X5 [Rhodamnia argentea]